MQVSELTGEQKVRDWEPTSQSHQNLITVHRNILSYLHISEKSRAAFAVADCGKIAISYVEIGLNKGSLSVIEPNTPNFRIVFNYSAETLFCNPIVIKQAGKELIATCTGRVDTIIHTWDLEKFRPTTVYHSWLTGHHLLCVIDNITVVCVAPTPFPDGTHRCQTLDTSVTPWELKAVLILPIESSLVTDVSYLKTTDGTSCLLLSTLGEVSVWAVDMLTGRTKWKTSWHNAYPVSICNDSDKKIYVADYRLDKVKVLSEEDGTVTDSISLRQYEIFAPHCIRIHDNFVYLAHKHLKETNTFLVSKISTWKK